MRSEALALLVLAACTPIIAPTMKVRSISPIPGTPVTPDSVIDVELAYKAVGQTASHLFVILVFSTTGPGGSRNVYTPGSTLTVPLSDTSGVIHIHQPLDSAWRARDLARPFKVWIILQKPTHGKQSRTLYTIGPIEYPRSKDSLSAVTSVEGPAGVATSCAGLTSADSTIYDTTQVTEPPRLRDPQAVRYPSEQRRQGKQGRVVVTMVIEADGTVAHSSARILEGVDPALDAEALRWARDVHFWPACRDHQRVRVRVAQAVNFKL